MTQIHPKQLSSGGASNGQALVYNSTSGLFEPASVSESWTNAYTVDFTSLATETLTNGTETLDSKSWTIANSGNSSLFENTNGTGIRITPLGNSANRYDGGDRTLPIMTIPVTSLFADFDPGIHKLRLWIRFSLTNGFGVGNYQGWYGGFEPTGATANREYLAVGSRRDYGRNALWHMHSGTWAHGYRSTSVAITDGVAALDLIPYSRAIGWVKSQSGSDTWPEVSTMTTLGSLSLRPSLSSDAGPTFGVPYADVSDPCLNIFLSAFGWNYGSMTLTVRKLALDYTTY